jgi:hypothetical protein
VLRGKLDLHRQIEILVKSMFGSALWEKLRRLFR